MYFSFMLIAFSFLCEMKSAAQDQGNVKGPKKEFEEPKRPTPSEWFEDARGVLADVRKNLALKAETLSGIYFYEQTCLNFINLIESFIESLDNRIFYNFHLSKYSITQIKLSEYFYRGFLLKDNTHWSVHFTFLRLVQFYLCSDFVLDFLKRALNSSEKNSIKTLIGIIDSNYYDKKGDFGPPRIVYSQLWNTVFVLTFDKSIQCNFIWRDSANDTLYKELIDLLFIKNSKVIETESSDRCSFSLKNLYSTADGTFILKNDATNVHPKIIVISDETSDKDLLLIQAISQKLYFNSEDYVKKTIMYTTSGTSTWDNIILMRYDDSKWNVIEKPENFDDHNIKHKSFFAVMFELSQE